MGFKQSDPGRVSRLGWSMPDAIERYLIEAHNSLEMQREKVHPVVADGA